VVAVGVEDAEGVNMDEVRAIATQDQNIPNRFAFEVRNPDSQLLPISMSISQIVCQNQF